MPVYPDNSSMCFYCSSSIALLAAAISVLSAAYPSIAFQPSTSILQSPHHYCYPSTSIERSTYTSGSLSYTTNEDDSSADVPITISIHSLLEEKRIDDAIIALRQYSHEVPASTYHEVIEACCAGGYDKNDRRRRPVKNNNSSKKKGRSKENEIDRIDLALDLLQNVMPSDIVTPHAHELLISGYARRGNWQDASQLLSSMEDLFVTNNESGGASSPLSLNVYQTVLLAYAKANQTTQMNTLLTKMRRHNIRPTVYTYNSLLKEFASSKIPKWKECLSLLSQCQREPGVTPDLITYTTAMRACARGKQTSKAMELFRVVKDMNLELDVYIYTTAMDACAKGGRWKKALSLLDEMKSQGIIPNEVTYGVAVTACGNGGQWEHALELLEQMKLNGLKINTITYNSAIAALSKAARNSEGDITSLLWEKALLLIKDMEDDGIKRDSFTFSSAISTCGAAGRWEEAVSLINDMNSSGSGSGTKPNRVAYTSAISACANSRQWEPAYDLFTKMKNDGVQPDLVAYNALIGAGMTADKPSEVFDIWKEMCQSSNQDGDKNTKNNKKTALSPDIVTLTEVIATLDNASGKVNRERVDEVFIEAVDRGLILRKDSLDTSWEVDLSNMSQPIARAACRYIFNQIAQRHAASDTTKEEEEDDVKDLSLITGASRMREHVRGILRDELKPSIYCVVPKLEQGTLLVKKKMVQNYINEQGR